MLPSASVSRIHAPFRPNRPVLTRRALQNGTEAETAKYAKCQQSCITNQFFSNGSSGGSSSGGSGSGGSDSGSDSSKTTGGASATGTSSYVPLLCSNPPFEFVC